MMNKVRNMKFYYGFYEFLFAKSIIFCLSFVVVVEDECSNNISNGMGSKSMDSINSYDGSRNPLDDGDDVEKARLISQVLELQITLDDLNQRVDGVKEENLRLKSENMVLGQYIGITLIYIKRRY